MGDNNAILALIARIEEQAVKIESNRDMYEDAITSLNEQLSAVEVEKEEIQHRLEALNAKFHCKISQPELQRTHETLQMLVSDHEDFQDCFINHKIVLIRTIKNVYNLNLREAKDLVDNAIGDNPKEEPDHPKDIECCCDDCQNPPM